MPVVAGDSNGNVVRGLREADFSLFDRRKRQRIAYFSMEGGESTAAARPPSDSAPRNAVGVPERFVAFVFDDVHFVNSAAPGDRAAAYSVSGQTTQDFTADRSQFERALATLMPRPIMMTTCPDVSDHAADAIVNRQDRTALGVVIRRVFQCQPGILPSLARTIAETSARQAVQLGDESSRAALTRLRNVVERMSKLPGSRTLVLASSGFITPGHNRAGRRRNSEDRRHKTEVEEVREWRGCRCARRAGCGCD